MEKYKLGEMEQKLANLIWENEPLTSRELSLLCEKEFTWKRTTTYTMLKRLCDRDLFINNKGAVSSLIKKNEFHAMQGEEFIEQNFNGSLPKFLTAFTKRNKLSSDEIKEIQDLIDSYKEE